MSTDAIRSHPTFICMSRLRVTGPTVPAGRWAWRPLTGQQWAGVPARSVTAVNDLFTVVSNK